MPARTVQAIPKVEEALEQFGLCVVDTTSVLGLAALERAHPRHWREILRRGAASRRIAVTEDTTLEELLASGHFGLGLPTASMRASTLKRDRGCMRRVSVAVGDLVVFGCTEDALVRRERRYARDHAQMSRDLLLRDLRLLRRAVHLAQSASGDVPVAASAAPPPRRRQRRSRAVPTPATVVAILGAMPDPSARVAVALAAGAGLLEGEILRLCAGRFAIRDNALWLDVVGGRVRGRPGRRGHRFFALPRWVSDLVLAAFPGLATAPPPTLLFPHRTRRGAHRTSFRRVVRSACDRAGVPRVTLGDLRRLFQYVLRSNRAPRCAVRGTMWRHPRRDADIQLQFAYARAVNQITLRWTELVRPPGGGVLGRVHVPKAAPKGVHPFEPELKRTPRRRAPPPLPASCAPGQETQPVKVVVPPRRVPPRASQKNPVAPAPPAARPWRPHGAESTTSPVEDPDTSAAALAVIVVAVLAALGGHYFEWGSKAHG